MSDLYNNVEREIMGIAKSHAISKVHDIVERETMSDLYTLNFHQ